MWEDYLSTWIDCSLRGEDFLLTGEDCLLMGETKGTGMVLPSMPDLTLKSDGSALSTLPRCTLSADPRPMSGTSLALPLSTAAVLGGMYFYIVLMSRNSSSGSVLFTKRF